MKARPGLVSGPWLISLVAFPAIVVLIVTLGIALNLQPRPSGNPLPASQSAPAAYPCVPPPKQPRDEGTRTPTPGPSDFGKQPVVEPVAVTPWLISKSHDLAPNLPDRDKAYVYVWRCNGTLELFRIDPASVRGSLEAAVPLQAGDIILDLAPPASLMGHQVPPLVTEGMPSVVPTHAPFIPSVVPPTSVPTLLPYPGPQTSETPTSVIAPYPGVAGPTSP